MSTTVWLTYIQKSSQPDSALHLSMTSALTQVFQEATGMKEAWDLHIFYNPIPRVNFSHGGQLCQATGSGICRADIEWMPVRNEYEQRRVIDKKLTQEMAKILQMDPSKVQISYREINSDNFTVGGSRLSVPPARYR